MERRQFIAAGALAGLAGGAATRAAAADHAHDHDHGSAPAGAPHDHPTRFAALAASSAECVATGNDCLRHCFAMLAMNDARMAACTRSTYDLVHACAALQTLAAVDSPRTPAMARAVAEICTACEAECAKFPDIAECRACRDSCRRCAAECRKIAA
ncbi:twin-arginine translocation signal/Cys-rich four helix bundle protein [Methylobacterium sp. ap11]|uniref:four-helix bundle copper-binding protein n=1 Tax=Methylobacterium sp. ap11 TaxID=1761799 RepID=UPI0008CC7029|nr:four-helix bundle copper-binding protein [Methylobacterium sp. ap11]SEP50468.1 twin-arginine translocation signal/Cys-rich four helix bundle protein [Methylobacterium sp. ap11]